MKENNKNDQELEEDFLEQVAGGGKGDKTEVLTAEVPRGVPTFNCPVPKCGKRIDTASKPSKCPGCGSALNWGKW